MQADEVVLRQAGPDDAPALAVLIAGLSGYFLAEPDGRRG